MNSKMTTNSQLSTTQPKNKKAKTSNELRKQLEQEQISRNGDKWRVIIREMGENKGKGTGNKKHNL